MYGKAAAVLLSGLLLACAPAQPPAPAPLPPPPVPAAAPPEPPAGSRFVNIRGTTCETFLGLSVEDRADAVMFYAGYEASRFGVRDINVPAIPSIEGLALRYCAAFPQRPVVAAFAEAFRVTKAR